MTISTPDIIDLVVNVLSTIGGSALVTALVPSKVLGFLNPLLQFVAANFGHAQNASTSN